MSTDVAPESSTNIVPILSCPQTRIRDSKEVTLQWSDGHLTSGEYHYQLVDGVPNLRLPFDQETFTSYDDILKDFPKGTPVPDMILQALSLDARQFRGARILLGGTAQGADINWIMSLEPEHLTCLDYSPFITKIAKGYSDKRISFCHW